VRLGYVRGDGLRVVIDEHAPGVARVAVRQPGGAVRTIEDVSAGERFEVIDRIELRLGERWEHARPFPRPQPVPRVDREGDFIGTHDRAMLAVELSLPQSGWRRVVWLPFSRYLNIGGERGRAVELPDGRRVRLAFGRARRVLPGFHISMVDFEMVSYDHRGAPRDYAIFTVPMTYVRPDLAVEGTQLMVKMQDKLWPASVTCDSPYDPSNAAIRVDG